ncbi:histamine H3 receptor-like [Mizuhopecten yessoensis]|uniref:Histamine H4 receptor n=1 Tax=Mizuhopecten yessoensis TaxID=6573 RepID=A0A210PRL2_MIZYE|nr:histamine H3 receptor-like [Mizuhopecten yessoensis]OWF39129.1 Histamine H4 receptor [Mizuhopecten yessoensis]
MSTNITEGAAEDSAMSLPVLVVIAVLITIMIILTMGGNLIVLIIFAKDKSVRQFSDCLIVNLAISDLIIGSFCIPLYAPLLLTGNWPFGHGVCLLWLVFDYVTPAASTLNICCISFDRYLQVGHPLWARTNRTNKLLVALLVIPWLLPALFFLPAITLWEVGQGPIIPENTCFLPYNESIMMLLGGTLIEFIFPFIMVATFNILVYITIRQRSKRFMKAVTAPATAGNNQNTDQAPEPKKGGHSTNNANKSFQQDRKAARSLFILVLTFAICWMPFEVTALVSTICGGCVDLVLFEVIFWLLWINSTINPVLYPLLHSRYRRAFLNLITKKKNRVVPLPAATSAVITTT